MFWLCSKSSLHVYLLCSLWKHLLHSHTKSHSLSHKRRHVQPMINHKCRACCLHHRLVMFYMCVYMVWVISSSSHRSVSLQDYICIFQSSTHLVIFYEVLTTRLPFDSQAITSPLTWSNVTENSAEAPSKSFQVVLLARKSISLHVGQLKSLTQQPPWDWLPWKITQSLQALPTLLTEKIVQTSRIDTQCPSLSLLGNYAIFLASPPNRGSATHPKNCVAFMSRPSFDQQLHSSEIGQRLSIGRPPRISVISLASRSQ